MRTAVGGSAVPESVLRAFDAQGIRILHAWSMTEISPLGTVSFVKSTIESLSEDEKYQYRSRQGIPAPWVEIRADNEEGEVPWDGETMGELLVRGPCVAGSYHNNPTDLLDGRRLVPHGRCCHHSRRGLHQDC